MSHTHDHSTHGHGPGKNVGTRSLIVALLLNVGITVAQVIGGLVAGSLSLLADAAHNGSDAAALGISYGARKISRRDADRKRTFGYARAELIGAMINLTVLFVIALFLLWQAIERFVNPPEVEGTVMLIVGGIAFVEDLISVLVLRKGARGSLNIRSAMIHLIGDTLATVGVIVGGLLIMQYGIHWVDPALTAAIAVYVFVHSYIEIRKTIRILMESAPKGFDFDRMVREVEKLEKVENLHHVHLWRLDEQRIALEAHVAITRRDVDEMEDIKSAIKQKLKEDFGIEHTTLEFEFEHCADHGRALIVEE